jgi:hypothetical protein
MKQIIYIDENKFTKDTDFQVKLIKFDKLSMDKNKVYIVEDDDFFPEFIPLSINNEILEKNEL